MTQHGARQHIRGPRASASAQSACWQRGPSLFAQRLVATQKLRGHYGVTERELRGLVTLAARAKEDAGMALVQLLERQAISVIVRAGFARSVPAARQLVAHGHIAVNGRVLDVPSARLRRGDVLAVRPRAHDAVRLQRAGGTTAAAPAWLEVDDAGLTVRLTSLPGAQAIPVPVEIGLVVEFYTSGAR